MPVAMQKAPSRAAAAAQLASLQAAVRAGDARAVAALLEAGVDANAQVCNRWQFALQ